MAITLHLPAVNLTYRSHLALLFVSLIYGANYSIAKMVMPAYLGASGFIIFRIGGAGLLFWILNRLLKSKAIQREDWSKILICSILGVAANMLMFFEGLERTTPMHASVLMLITPVFVFLASLFIKKQKPNLPESIGVLLAFAGSVLLVGGFAFRFSSRTLNGDLLIIGNALSYALYLIFVRDLIQKYSSLQIVSSLFLLGFIWVLPFGYQDVISAPFEVFPEIIWAAIAFVVLGTTFIAYLLNAWAMQYTGAKIVGSYIYLQPVFATFISAIWFREVLSFEKMIASICIFTGVFFVSGLYKKR